MEKRIIICGGLEEISLKILQSSAIEKNYKDISAEQSDFISVHIPLTPETYDLVNQAAFRKMKPGVRLICTARGGIINEAALLEALEDGLVAGAALDVFNQEPPGMMPLIAHPNVIATPHIGAQTREAQERAAENIAVEVLAALEGRPLRWRIE